MPAARPPWFWAVCLATVATGTAASLIMKVYNELRKLWNIFGAFARGQPLSHPTRRAVYSIVAPPRVLGAESCVQSDACVQNWGVRPFSRQRSTARSITRRFASARSSAFPWQRHCCWSSLAANHGHTDTTAPMIEGMQAACRPTAMAAGTTKTTKTTSSALCSANVRMPRWLLGGGGGRGPDGGSSSSRQ